MHGNALFCKLCCLFLDGAAFISKKTCMVFKIEMQEMLSYLCKRYVFLMEVHRLVTELHQWKFMTTFVRTL